MQVFIPAYMMRKIMLLDRTSAIVACYVKDRQAKPIKAKRESHYYFWGLQEVVGE